MSNSIYTAVYNPKLRELPNGYTQLEYIEGTGTQYIDTNFIPNHNTRIVTTYEIPNLTGTIPIAGTRNTESTDGFIIYLEEAHGKVAMYGNTYILYGAASTYEGSKTYVDFNGPAKTITYGEDTRALTNYTFTSNYSLPLFAFNLSGTIHIASSMRIYFCEIYDNGTIIRDYVPCINADGVTGFYDTINNLFYSSSGTDNFIAGDIVQEIVAKKNSKNYIVAKNFDPKLSLEGYTPVEYIESSGTQFIDTGFTPNYQSACELTMEYAAVVTANVNCGLFGGSGSSRNVTAFECFYQSSTMYYSFGTGYDVSTSLSVNEKFTMKISQSEAKMTKNGTTVFSATPSASTFTSPSTFIIFGLNRNNTASYLSSSRCYGCKLWDNGVLVRNLIPCINPNNEAGLYDLITSTFYSNSGTGTLIAGPEVEIKVVAKEIQKGYIVKENFEIANLPEGYTQVEYIESSGTQYIDTGFSPNNLSSCEVITSCSVMNSSANGCFGAAGANYTTDAFEFYYNGKVCNVGFGDTPLRYTSSVAINDILKININKNERTVFLNKQLLCTDVPATETFTCPATFILGALNRAGNIEYYSANKIYSCKLWDNGTLARDLIPCINPSNEVGMYDLVNNIFYGNSGTGTFTAGPTYKEITKLFYEGGN